MKTKTIKHKKEIILKPTRQYTCSRRRNKQGKKIWVVLEDGRKFYRIFKNRSLAINYFTTLKTIYAEMLVQDLKENVFSSIVYTKLETKQKGLVKSHNEFFGGIVEESDQLFDEDLFLNDSTLEETEYAIEPDFMNENPSSNVVEKHDFSFVDNLFPQPKPLISPFKVKIDTSKNVFVNKKLISDESEIKIYQSDLDLSLYVLGESDYSEHKKFHTIIEKIE